MQTADFYSSATGTLRVNGGRDENAPKGVALSIDDLSYIKQGSRANESSGTSTTDYNELTNKPQINNVTLESNKTAAQLGLATISDISSIKQVPTVTSSDNNKVLTASYSGGIASYAWIPASSGTSDYTELSNKPQINSITLTGNVSLSDIGAQPTIDSSHKVSADNIDDTNTTNKFATAAQLSQIETNKNNILIEDITSTYTIETGYTLSTYSKVYKQGKHVFGLLSIKKDTGTIPTSQTAIATATNKPALSYVTGCFCGTSEWDISTTGYVFINPSTGAILARDTADPTTNTTFNIQVDYVIS